MVDAPYQGHHWPKLYFKLLHHERGANRNRVFRPVHNLWRTRMQTVPSAPAPIGHACWARGRIASRIGIGQAAETLLRRATTCRHAAAPRWRSRRPAACVFIDEAQFLGNRPKSGSWPARWTILNGRIMCFAVYASISKDSCFRFLPTCRAGMTTLARSAHDLPFAAARQRWWCQRRGGQRSAPRCIKAARLAAMTAYVSLCRRHWRAAMEDVEPDLSLTVDHLETARICGVRGFYVRHQVHAPPYLMLHWLIAGFWSHTNFAFCRGDGAGSL